MSSSEDEATRQGDLLRDKGDFDGAIAAYTEAIRLDPKLRQAFSARADVYISTSEFDKAIADFNEAAKLDPQRAEVYCGRGWSYDQKGEFNRAIADYTEAIKLDPQRAEVYYWRACSYKKKGDYDNAIADFVQARKLANEAEPGRPAKWHTANESRHLLAIVWASPYTLLGLFLGGIGLCTGSRARLRGGAVEFYGGGVKWLLQRFPTGQFPLACTMGHTILGQTDASLDIARDHELVHVRQFERWGPLMAPAYLGCCLVLWLMRRRPYWDNPFEREARGDTPPMDQYQRKTLQQVTLSMLLVVGMWATGFWLGGVSPGKAIVSAAVIAVTVFCFFLGLQFLFHRRWPQFSLRTLLAMSLVAVALGAIMWAMRG